MADEWDDGDDTLMNSFFDGIRPPGVGRGYRPPSINNNVENYRLGNKVNNHDRVENKDLDSRCDDAEVNSSSDAKSWGTNNGSSIGNDEEIGKSNGLRNGRNDAYRNGSSRNTNINGNRSSNDGDNENRSRRYNDRNGEKTQENGSRKDSCRSNRDTKNRNAEKTSEKWVPYIPPEVSSNDDEIFSGVTAGLNFSKYDDIKVIVNGDNIPEAIDDFAKMDLRDIVIRNIVKSKYAKPTPIQKNAIPMIRNGRDVMACAQTGSGKTAAFMVPIINTLLEKRLRTDFDEMDDICRPQCLILSPTRELAEQTWRQAIKFSRDSILKCVTIYGGVSINYNVNKVAKGCHILVATPGRLLDFLNIRKCISLESVRFVVLDEADRMLDMGFLDDIEKIMEHRTMADKSLRQTLMFSATFCKQVRVIARQYLARDYLFVAIGEIGSACTDVEQILEQVEKIDKREKLNEIFKAIDKKNIPRTLIFVDMKIMADSLAAWLSGKSIPTTSIHGDRMQQQRDEALRDFRSGRMPVLVATGVASRGLDIKDVAHVINYDLPKEIDEYVHRIGRTGRVGNRGKATSFFDPERDSPIARDLVGVLKNAGQEVPDWLERVGGYSYRNSKRDTFGGRDTNNVRNDTVTKKSEDHPNTPSYAQDEDSW